MKTRTISKFFGLLGFAGFLGPIAYSMTGWIGSLVFIGFFGFFAFYFEGKMSGTLRDELFIENENKANRLAYRIGLSLVFLALVCCVNWIEPQGYREAYTFLIVAIASIWALTLNLSMGLLYYYERRNS